jgi:hypothetical protein
MFTPTPEIIEAARAFMTMCVHGFFSAVGAIFSYFYHVDRDKLIMSFKTMTLWCFLGWGVGMFAGQFIASSPSYISDHTYGALFVAGAFWRQSWGYAATRVSAIARASRQ